MASDDDLLTEAREAFKTAQDFWEQYNFPNAREDLRFARLADQWPEPIKKQREQDQRPCLTVNRLPTFIRQVVNDSRQNKPQIKVKPVDSKADPETAEVINGLIRNIEVGSQADTAYDTAIDFAATMGFGYIRVDIDYAHDDTFEQDIRIERVSNPFGVYGDPFSTAADSSDWNMAFLVEPMRHKIFEARYHGHEKVDWEAYRQLGTPWYSEETVMVAEYWTREEDTRKILLLDDGQVISESVYLAQQALFFDRQVEAEREVKTHKVKQVFMSGAEVLDQVDWPGRYIPIVPVYGDEVNVEGERHFRSLIRDAKDSQRQYNYWRSASTELVALAPKAPWVGPEKAFQGKDSEKWANANIANYSYLSYAGTQSPQRQHFAGIPAGALQETLISADDMKGVMGLYDAALGAKSNETSGKAIIARQREGDVSTFHFIDNLSRAIRHTGRIILDLIPEIYTGPRVVRVIGEDGEVSRARLAGPEDQPRQAQMAQGQNGQQERIEGIYDLGAGKYDLAVDAGPSFTTRREEAATQMIELIRAFPQAAPVIGDLLAKNLDWPGADEVARRLSMLVPSMASDDPRIKKLVQALQEAQQKIRKLEGDRAEAMMEHKVDVGELGVKAYDAETKRMKAVADIMESAQPPAPSANQAGRY